MVYSSFREDSVGFYQLLLDALLLCDTCGLFWVQSLNFPKPTEMLLYLGYYFGPFMSLFFQVNKQIRTQIFPCKELINNNHNMLGCC